VSDATHVWDDVPDWGGVGARRLVRSAPSALGASIWELQPGSSQFVCDVAGEHRYHRVDDALEHAGPD